MRTRPLQPTPGRVEGVLQIEEVCQREGILPREKHLQSRDGRKILARSDALSAMTLAIMLHSVHFRGKEDEDNKHQQ
jgi:hypothetical protein